MLTDRLTCPRCGPDFGLILLARDVAERRVLAGSLGCPNCRDRYPVEDGFGDLRVQPRNPITVSPEDPVADVEEATKIAALLGATAVSGPVLLSGTTAFCAASVSELLDDVEVAALHPALREWKEAPGVSRLASGPGLPFYGGTFHGLALGEGGDVGVDEAIRCVAPLGRVALLDASGDASSRFESAGFDVLINDANIVVAARPGLG